MAKEDSIQGFDLVALIYYAISIFLGVVLIAVGAWFFASPDVRAYMTIFVTAPNDHTLIAAGALILVCGIVLALISVLALVGVLKKNIRFIVLHLWLQAIVIVLGLVAGFMTTALYWDTHLHVKDGMRGQLNDYYDWDSTLGKAWNRVQVKKRCCGIDGSWDYASTSWYNSKNPIDAKVTTYVPLSCCKLIFNQDQWLYWVDPQNLQVKDALRCQQDAAGKIDNSANLNTLGCYAALFQLNKVNFWHDVTIFSVMAVIQGLGLSIGFLQIFGIVLDIAYLGYRRRQMGQV
jgi:hypothetical protein